MHMTKSITGQSEYISLLTMDLLHKYIGGHRGRALPPPPGKGPYPPEDFFEPQKPSFLQKIEKN